MLGSLIDSVRRPRILFQNNKKYTKQCIFEIVIIQYDENSYTGTGMGLTQEDAICQIKPHRKKCLLAPIKRISITHTYNPTCHQKKYVY